MCIARECLPTDLIDRMMQLFGTVSLNVSFFSSFIFGTYIFVAVTDNRYS